jgi:hypothetical protein
MQNNNNNSNQQYFFLKYIFIKFLTKNNEPFSRFSSVANNRVAHDRALGLIHADLITNFNRRLKIYIARYLHGIS